MTVSETAQLLAAQGYIADHELATTVHLALAMRRPELALGLIGVDALSIEMGSELARLLVPPLARSFLGLLDCYLAV